MLSTVFKPNLRVSERSHYFRQMTHFSGCLNLGRTINKNHENHVCFTQVSLHQLGDNHSVREFYCACLIHFSCPLTASDNSPYPFNRLRHWPTVFSLRVSHIVRHLSWYPPVQFTGDYHDAPNQPPWRDFGYSTGPHGIHHGWRATHVRSPGLAITRPL
jgi:hypothetical protein